MKLALKGRLRSIADKVPVCEILYDVGSDHGYLGAYCVSTGKSRRAVLSDIKPSPAILSFKNTRAYGLGKKTETIIADGLEHIDPDMSADYVIVIAGMGGATVAAILDAGYQAAASAKAIILQPMNSPDIAAEWLIDHHYEIYDEELVKEDRRIYVIISARKLPESSPEAAGRVAPAISGQYGILPYRYFGRILEAKGGLLLSEYAEKAAAHFKRVTEGNRSQREKEGNIQK
ncbi:MAG: class I SAM-dependent methyltransferase [Eubacteriales bacterium]|nr:class I SAM-dependent methyltransferase [Eubacteriales bacterium]